MPRDHFRAAADDDLADVTADLNLAMMPPCESPL